MSVAGFKYNNNNGVVVIHEPQRRHPEPGYFELGQAMTSEGDHMQERGGDEESANRLVTKLPWQVTIWAWVVLVIQGLVMGMLYLDGGGRTAALAYPTAEDGALMSVDDDLEPKCLVAEGKPGLAEAVALRAVTAVSAQLILFCVSDRGLMKPHEAMWVIFAYIMRLWGKSAGWCFACAADMSVTETEVVERDSNGNVTKRYQEVDSGYCACCMFTIIWVMIPAAVVWSFTAFPATLNLMAICELVLHGVAIYWFRMGSLLFLIACTLLLSCLSDTQKAKSIIPFARAFVVVDSLTIGVTTVWGNYVQSGVVAGVFALLPLANVVLTGLELRN